MLKHTVVITLLTLGLAAPAFAQAQTPTPPVTANGQKAARVAPRAKRAARLGAPGDQGRTQLRASLKALRAQMKTLRKSGASSSIKERRQLRRQFSRLRMRLGKLRHRGK